MSKDHETGMSEDQTIVLTTSQRSGTDKRRQRVGKPLQRHRGSRKACSLLWEGRTNICVGIGGGRRRKGLSGRVCDAVTFFFFTALEARK